MSKSLFGYGLTTKAIATSGGWEIFDDKFKEYKKDEFGNSLLPINKFDAQKANLKFQVQAFHANIRLP